MAKKGNCSIMPGNSAWMTMHNIFKSFRRKSESRCFSSVFDCPVLLSSYKKRRVNRHVIIQSRFSSHPPSNSCLVLILVGPWPKTRD